MIKVSEVEVMNFKGAFKGMRNPLESWEKSDSCFSIATEDYDYDYDVVDKWVAFEHSKMKEGKVYSTSDTLWNNYDQWIIKNGLLRHESEALDCAFIGPNDMQLAQKLVLAGDDHSKFMRQIFVSMDITAPLYFFKEFDTYKVGTTANSTSTMHKLATTPITRECFSFDYELNKLEGEKKICFDHDCAGMEYYSLFESDAEQIIHICEIYRQRYLETKDVRYWRALIQLLPSSWNQKRTWTANYAVLRSIYFSRKTHKLQEWKDFCKEIEKLPYAKELICIEKEKT